ncbi:hypothetical protein ACQCSX_21280 (plasmid) [Pseudarthrobacter sp. P1]|uniref:hypothetical protein n=1 Tax=Pseudarthrobacter sp. P1 TaxID=3418418 RepID=UPI003CF770E8
MRRDKTKAVVSTEHATLTDAWYLLSDDESYDDSGGDSYTKKDPPRQKQRHPQSPGTRVQGVGSNAPCSSWTGSKAWNSAAGSTPD